MATRLEQAFTEASKLSPKEQDALADWVLAELRSKKNGIDYSPILKRNYPNWLVKHLPNIIVDKRRNSTQTNYELKNDKTLPSDAGEITLVKILAKSVEIRYT